MTTSPITPAVIDWKTDDNGHTVPVSREYGDVYFSMVDGLAESRYVFLEQNQLPTRFANLTNYQTFTIAELGFGTGLNILALWQLWRQSRKSRQTIITSDTESNSAISTSQNAKNLETDFRRLHVITTEQHPLSKADLTKALSGWAAAEPELAPLIDRLLDAYPTLVAGCHRLSFWEDSLTIDLWLGDAADSLSKLDIDAQQKDTQKIDAWFLDGFAPACNADLWAEKIFQQIQRLSGKGTTAATFSCAGVVKRGFKAIGFDIQKVAGFGRKREMLIANQPNHPVNSTSEITPTEPQASKPQHVAIVGAGVSGLMNAWSLAQRGIKVTLLDKERPLAGASGNPRGVLAPKMTPLAHVAEHLHTIGYLYGCRFYQQLDNAKTANNANTTNNATIFEQTGVIDLLTKANVNSEQITAYPEEMAQVLCELEAKKLTGLTQQSLTDNLYLPQAGLVNPQALATQVLAHSYIDFQQFEVASITVTADSSAVVLSSPQKSKQTQHFNERPDVKEGAETGNNTDICVDAVVICSAYESHLLDERIFDCRKICGQLSWFTPTAEQLNHLPKLPVKYGGYCAPFVPAKKDKTLNQVDECQSTFLLGASFIRNETNTQITTQEHLSNRQKLISAMPELAAVIPEPNNTQKEEETKPSASEGNTSELNPTEQCLEQCLCLEQGLNDNPVHQANWQARVGIRAQTPDYHPVVGQIDEAGLIWTMCGMGSKGFAFAPICAEVLADKMLGQFAPLSAQILARIHPNRPRLQRMLD